MRGRVLYKAKAYEYNDWKEGTTAREDDEFI